MSPVAAAVRKVGGQYCDIRGGSLIPATPLHWAFEPESVIAQPQADSWAKPQARSRPGSSGA